LVGKFICTTFVARYLINGDVAQMVRAFGSVVQVHPSPLIFYNYSIKYMSKCKDTPIGVRFFELYEPIKEKVKQLKSKGIRIDFSKFVRDACEEKLKNDKD
jgi:hypothetical protein